MDAICAHKNIRTGAEVCYMEDIGEWSADITIKCLDCGEPFHFKGLPMGCSLTSPCVSVDATELRVPIMPGILMPHMRKADNDAVEIIHRRFVKTPEDEVALEKERQIAKQEVLDFSQRLIGAKNALELAVATMQGHLEAFPGKTESNFRENMITTFTELLGDNDKMDQIVDGD